MLSAIVLAAGQAVRFGHSKQLAVFRGKPLLQHSVDAVNASHAAEVVVVLGAYADEIRKQVSFGRARTVLNPDHEEGMSTSLRTGLAAIREDADGVIIALADQPLVRTRTLDLLMDEFERVRPAVLIPTFEGRSGNPVVIGRQLFAEAMKLEGDTGFRAVFGRHHDSIATLAVDDRGVVIDVDTLDDFERL